LAYWFQRKKIFNIFPIGSYVKTMSADGGHLGWRLGSQDIILKVNLGRNLKNLLVRNHQTNWIVTLQEWSLGGPVLNLGIICGS
jgi:hypothetical protein